MNNGFKKFGALICAAAVAGSVLTTSLSAWATGMGTTYYVATDGNDANDGKSQSKAFKTIQKAADTVGAGDTVIIAGGDYRETVVMAKILGTKDKPVLFKAKGNEKVTINGTEKVTGAWEKLNGFTSKSGNVTGDVYKIKTDMPLGNKNQLFVNDRMQFLAQWPDRAGEGKSLNKADLSDLFMKPNFSWTKNFDDYRCNSTTVYDPKLPKDLALKGAVLNYKGTAQGAGWMGPVEGNTDDGKGFTVTNRAPNSRENIRNDREYYINNHLNLLNVPGEWYYDGGKKELYLCVETGTDMSTLDVEKKVRGSGLTLGGGEDEETEYVTLENIDVFGTNLNFSGTALGCTIDGMEALYLNHNLYNNEVGALYISGTDNAIWNSEIAYNFAGGITTYGTGNKVINCHLHDFDYGITGASSISMWGENEIIYKNTAHNVPRSMIGGGSRGVRVAYNHLYDNGMLTKDCGMIYYGTGDGGNMEIDHNVLHNNHTVDNAMGLYFDCGGQNYTAHHNVMYDLDVYGLSFNTPSHNMLLFNNTVYDSQGSMNDWSWAKLDSYKRDQNGTYFMNNIIAYTHKKEGNHPVVPFSVSDVATVKTNIITPENEKPTDLFTDPDKFDFTLKNGDTDRNKMARTGGTPVRGLVEDTGKGAYIGAFDPEKQPWTAGCKNDKDGKPDPTNNKLNRKETKFYDVNGDLEVDLEKPRTEIQYMNKVYNASFEGGVKGWTKEWDKSAGVIVSKTDAMTYGSGINAPAGKEDSRSAQRALRLGRGMDGVSQKITGLRPNTQYMVSAWSKIQEGQKLAIGVRNYKGTNEDMEIVTSDTNDGVWKRNYFYFTTGSNTETEIYLRTLAQTAASYVSLDDIAIQEYNKGMSEDFNDGKWNELKAEPANGDVEYRNYTGGADTSQYARLAATVADRNDKPAGTAAFHFGQHDITKIEFDGRFELEGGDGTTTEWRVMSDKYGGNTDSVVIAIDMFSNRQFRIIRRTDGKTVTATQQQITESAIAGKVPGFSFDDWHHYLFTVAKDTITVSIDGVDVLTFEDLPETPKDTYIFRNAWVTGKEGGKLVAEYDNVALDDTNGSHFYNEDFEDGKWDGITPKANADRDAIKKIEYPTRADGSGEADPVDEAAAESAKDKYAYLTSENGADFVINNNLSDPIVSFKARVPAETVLALKLRQNDAMTEGVRVELAGGKIAVYKGSEKLAEKEAKGLEGWHNYRAALSGNTLTVTMDGAEMIKLVHDKLKAAGSGMAFYAKGAAKLDNIQTPMADTGKPAQPVEYKPTVYDMNFTPLETRAENWNFESGRWARMTFPTRAGRVEDTGDAAHGKAFKMVYGDWAGFNYDGKIHNAMFSLDAKIDPNAGNTKDGGHIAIVARMFGASYYGLRVTPTGLYLQKVGLAEEWSEWCEYDFPEGYNVNEWHNYGFKVNKNVIEIYLDGEKLFTHVDEDQPLYYKDNSFDMRFETRYISGWIDNFKITPLSDSGNPVLPPDDDDDPLDGDDPLGGNDPSGGDDPSGGGDPADGGAETPDTGVAFPTAFITAFFAAGAALPILGKKRLAKYK